ncbi:MAG: FtsK/SpoIIIE domain-containing protein [Microbacteriaceae bacterium]
MLRDFLTSAAWASVKFLGRWVWRFLPSILWVTVTFLLLTNLQRGLLPIVLLIVLVAAAVASFVWPTLHRFRPVVSDWQRLKRARAGRRARVAGYRHGVAMGVVKALDEDAEAYAMKSPVKRLPVARLVETSSAVSLIVPQVGLFTDEDLEKRARAYAPVLSCPAEFARIERHSGGQVVRFVWPREAVPSRLDQSTIASLPSTPVDLLSPVVVGAAEDGSPVTIPLKDNSGAVVGGVPGSGKTAGTTTLCASLAATPAAQFVIFDGKGGSDWDWIAPRASLWNRDDEDLQLVRDQLEQLRQLMRYRAQTIKEVRGNSNVWNTGGPDAERFPLVTIIMDEAQTFYDATEYRGDKEKSGLVQEIGAIAASIERKGRSLGFLLVSITQKPTADSLPTKIRDNASIKQACRVLTREAQAAVLGETPEGTDASVTALAIPSQRQGGVTTVGADGRWVAGRFFYTPESVAADVAAASAHLRIPFADLVRVPELEPEAQL